MIQGLNIDKKDNDSDIRTELQHSCPICSRSSTNDNEQNESKLILILFLEIYRDGGISYLNQLKSHSTSSIISKLLSSFTPALKLATFMEQYPSIFNVQRRKAKKDFKHPEHSRNDDDRHTVSLQQMDIIDDLCHYCFLNTNTHPDQKSFHDQRKIFQQQLESQLYYILIKRNEKIKRRLERKKQIQNKDLSSIEFNNDSDSNHSIINNYASIIWLAHKLESELYQYSRLLDKQIRPFGTLVGSIDWWHMIIPIFITFIKETLSSSSRYIVNLHNDDTEIELIDSHHDSNKKTIIYQYKNDANNDSQIQMEYLQTNPFNDYYKISIELHFILTKKIHVPKLNGIDYGMLLQKHESLRKLLHGRDLIQIIQSEQMNPNSSLFHHVEIFTNNTNENYKNIHGDATTLDINEQNTNRNSNWRIRLKNPNHVSISNNHYPSGFKDLYPSNHDSIINEYKTEINHKQRQQQQQQQQHHRSLLYVANDDIGLYSVTGSKIASSMANSLYHQTIIQSLDRNKNDKPKKHSHNIPRNICIDLTAGVGGNTIACAKVFEKVIAYDIDEIRVHACRQNVNQRLKQNENQPSNVIVKCENALTALPELAQLYRQRKLSSSVNVWKSSHVDVSKEIHNCNDDSNTNENDDTMQVVDNKSNHDISIAVMLDPPWGGLNYRQIGNNDTIGLIGNDSETFVPIPNLAYLVSLYLAPTVLGIKLPLTFEVDKFMHQLCILMNVDRDMNDKVKIVSIKKMKRQLFLILRFL